MRDIMLGSDTEVCGDAADRRPSVPMDCSIAILTKEYEDGMDEVYEMWFRCPRCNDEYILKWFKYCPNCGIKLDTTAIR